MLKLLMKVAGMRLKVIFLAKVFVLRFMGNVLVPSPYTESRLFTFARAVCVTCESLFILSAKKHTRGIK